MSASPSSSSAIMSETHVLEVSDDTKQELCLKSSQTTVSFPAEQFHFMKDVRSEASSAFSQSSLNDSSLPNVQYAHDPSRIEFQPSQCQKSQHNANSVLSRCSLVRLLHKRCDLFTRGRCDKHCIMRTAKKFYHLQRQRVIPFIWGILVGVTITAVLFQQQVIYSGAIPWPVDGAKSMLINGLVDSHGPNKRPSSVISTKVPEASMRAVYKKNSHVDSSSQRSFSSLKVENQVHTKTRIYVGVITAEKFLGTRSVAVNNTWGSQVDKVEFFAEKGSVAKYHVPVVNLEGISDTEYPPQKKAFRMLQHMCKHHINSFEWFVRADDDVYIRVERLRKFLTQVDGDKTVYMGQPGHGVPDVRDKLGLKGHNFCMGGPGVLFNRKALKGLCPHIDQCMSEVLSGEEDVEIGRCVTKHLHIECTHAWETLKLFYHSYQEEYTEEKPFLGNLAENDHVDKALTLHHLKVPYIMYRVHRHYTSLLLNSTVQASSTLRNKLEQSNVVLPFSQRRHVSVVKSPHAEFTPRSMKESNAWQSFEVDSLYSLAPSKSVLDITNDVLADLKQVGETGIDVCIGHTEQQKFTYSHLSDGYLRSDPVRGTDYLLDVYFNSKQHDRPGQIHRVHLLRPLGEPEVTSVRESSTFLSGSGCLYIVVPSPVRTGSRLETFMRSFYEPAFLSRSGLVKATLIVVPVSDGADDEIVSNPSLDDVMNWYKIKYRDQFSFELLDGDAGDDDKVVELRIQRAYARGILHSHQLHGVSNSCGKSDPFVLLTQTNFSLSPNVYQSCALRAGKPSHTVERYDSYNFMQYRSGQRNSRVVAQLYQVVPFHVYPSASVAFWPANTQSNTMNTLLTSDHGFWDVSTSATESGNAVIAPLCGQLIDLLPSAREALSPSNTTLSSRTFADLLYNRVYSSELRILRAPDKDFVNIPVR